MAFQMLSSRQIADNIKRVRKEKKISQKKLAEMIDKTERTIQNYEAGQTDFSMSIIKDIAIALDINFRELLSTPENQDGMHVGISGEDSYQNKYKLESFADVINVLFTIQETYDLVCEDELIDAMIYEELSLKSQYAYLLRKAKEEKITCRMAVY